MAVESGCTESSRCSVKILREAVSLEISCGAHVALDGIKRTHKERLIRGTEGVWNEGVRWVGLFQQLMNSFSVTF